VKFVPRREHCLRYSINAGLEMVGAYCTSSTAYVNAVWQNAHVTVRSYVWTGFSWLGMDDRCGLLMNTVLYLRVL